MVTFSRLLSRAAEAPFRAVSRKSMIFARLALVGFLFTATLRTGFFLIGLLAFFFVPVIAFRSNRLDSHLVSALRLVIRLGHSLRLKRILSPSGPLGVMVHRKRPER